MIQLVIIVYFCQIIKFASSACCDQPGPATGYQGWPSGLWMQCPNIGKSCCGDCTDPTPMCGYESCNIFGCNCGDRCRTGDCVWSSIYRRRRMVFDGIDLNSDNKVDKDEAMHWWLNKNGIINNTNSSLLHRLNLDTLKAEFNKLDLNNDGELEIDEIDPPKNNKNNNNNNVTIRRLALVNNGNYRNWMEYIPDHLSLLNISIPGTHDTMTYHNTKDRWPFVADYIFTQAYDLLQSLRKGIRALDIRCRHIGNGFTIHHDKVYLQINLDGVLEIVTQYLASYPSETIIIRFKSEHTPEGNTRTEAQTFQAYIDDPKYKPYFWTGTTIPTLGQVRGKIVILNQITGSTNIGIPWGDDALMSLQDAWETVGDAKWTLIENQLMKSQENTNKLIINFLSASDPISHAPLSISIDMNTRLYNWHPMTPSGQPFKAGILMMDYPPQPLIRRIINKNDYLIK